MKSLPQTYSRRSILTASGLAAFGVFAAPVAGQPPKTALPTRPTSGDTLNRIDLMLGTIEKIQDRIQAGETTDVLGTVLEHSSARKSYTEVARTAVIEKDSTTAKTNLLEVTEIVEGDIDLLASVEDSGSVGDVLALERALLNQTSSAIDSVERLGVMPGDNPTF